MNAASSKFNEQTFEISFVIWFAPIEKVKELTNARFLKIPILVLSNPKSIRIEPVSNWLLFRSLEPKEKVFEISLSTSRSQSKNAWLIFFKLFYGRVTKVIS